jgi:hypothetical protein
MNGNNDTQVTALTLPPGSYVLEAKTVLTNYDQSDQNAICKVMNGSNVIDQSDIRIQGQGTFGTPETWDAEVANLGTASLPKGGSASLDCALYHGEAVEGVVIATAVTNLH